MGELFYELLEILNLRAKFHLFHADINAFVEIPLGNMEN